jgi:hypothetical protein
MNKKILSILIAILMIVSIGSANAEAVHIYSGPCGFIYKYEVSFFDAEGKELQESYHQKINCGAGTNEWI